MAETRQAAALPAAIEFRKCSTDLLISIVLADCVENTYCDGRTERDGGAPFLSFRVYAGSTAMVKRIPEALLLAGLLWHGAGAAQRATADELDFIPSMMGDFTPAFSGGMSDLFTIDQLMVPSLDLDIPLTLPPLDNPLQLTEPGPVDLYSTSVRSIQEIQQLLRTGGAFPPATAVGTIASDASLTTGLTLAGIQSLTASTPGLAYDIIPVVEPPADYRNAVDAVFQTRNGAGGTTAYMSSSSGAVLQAGADTIVGGEDLDAFYFYSYAVRMNVPTPSAGTGGSGRAKISESGSPIPRDRVFFNYGFFNNAAVTNRGHDLNRMVAGFERTFLDKQASLEVRAPFASTIDNAVTVGGPNSGSDVQMGMMSLYGKVVLWRQGSFLASAGAGVTLPTADDVSVLRPDGSRLVEIQSKSVHIQPFVGWAYAPASSWFAQGFLQFDFDTNGNPVLIDSGTGLASAGRINDANFVFADASVGYWLYESETDSLVQRIAPTAELHWSKSIQNTDVVQAGSVQVGNFRDNIDILTGLIGFNVMMKGQTQLSLGYGAPLTTGADQPFDGAFRMMLQTSLR